jgi:hypothetical protein
MVRETTDLIDLDFENLLPPVVSTVWTHPMRDFGVTTFRATVYRHALSFVMSATLPLTLFRSPLFWDSHDLLTCSGAP